MLFTCAADCRVLEDDNVEFREVTVYAPNIAAEKVSFYLRLAAFLDDPKQVVDDWNAILDPKIDRVGRGAWGSGRRESSLIDFIVHHDLVDRFRLDHPERGMWTWLDSLPSVRARYYLDRVFVRADTDFVTSPMFHYVEQTDPRLLGSVCGWLIGLVWPDTGSSIPS